MSSAHIFHRSSYSDPSVRICRVSDEGDFYYDDPRASAEDDLWKHEPDWWEMEDLGDAATRQDPVYVRPSEFTEFSIMVPDKEHHTTVNFAFEPHRRYLRRPYDTPFKRILLKTGRQVEKTVREDTGIIMDSGNLVQIKDLRVGDSLGSLDERTDTARTAQVTWKSDRYRKKCLQITTKKGFVIEAGISHPFLKLGYWEDADRLKVGDRIGVARQLGVFKGVPSTANQVSFCALMIGDGCAVGQTNFTQNRGSAGYVEFLGVCRALGWEVSVYPKKGSKADSISVQGSAVRDLLQSWGLWGKKSAEKFVPDFVWDLSREQTALFLNRLWSTDGHVGQQTRSKYELSYCSISERLIRDVQRLLWKFGIPSSVRKFIPKLYKGTGKVAYSLRILTKEGVSIFLQEIGALGKSEEALLPDESLQENNNQDTIPIEVNDLILQIMNTHPESSRSWSRWTTRSLYGEGLRRTLKYPPTRGKVLEYVAYFRADRGFDQSLVDCLERAATSDIYWDEIISIEDIGEQWCYDISVGDTENFVAQGFITHNSTLLGNKCLAYMSLVPNLTILYVSPTNPQTKQFSNDRLTAPILLSPALKAFNSTATANNVFYKRFVNGSQIVLRHAYMNADRTRGISADVLLIDEIQDIISHHLPVIEECTSHSPFQLFSYSGTPKSMDNPIEFYWRRFSTQNEWVVPCRRHRPPTAGVVSRSAEQEKRWWYWNILSEDNIGRNGLVCDQCGQPIYPDDPDCTWAAMNPNPTINGEPVETPFEGFHISQLMTPWKQGKHWKELLNNQIKYPRQRWMNEVLGESFDSGSRPLCEDDVRRNCHESKSFGLLNSYEEVEIFLTELRRKVAGMCKVYVGIDWGGGGSSETSYTVIAMGAYLPGDNRFTIFYVHRFHGQESEPDPQLRRIFRLLDAVGFSVAFTDHGNGQWPNDLLKRKYGSDRIYEVQYSAPSKWLVWDPGMYRYLVHRTFLMSRVFSAIKRGGVFCFPHWEMFKEPYAQDMLSIFSEYNETTRMTQYSKAPDSSDDTFHAVALCFLGSQADKPRPDVFFPDSDD